LWASVIALAFLVLPAEGRAAGRPRPQSFDSNGVKIAYLDRGTGEPVVLIHGWLSSAGINWVLPGTFGLLAKDHRVIAMDVRGHGFSDKPTNADAYGLEVVDDVARLLDHLRIEKAHIVGYSMGGIIAAKFLARYPDRALSGTLGGAGWLREGSVEQKVFAAGGKDGKPVGLCFQGLAKLALTEKELRSIRVPVAMLVGDKDGLKLLYVDPAKKVRQEWAVVLIKGADHVRCIMKPEFREEIEAWLHKNKAANSR
jgi:pimeloyl-ACP methyl ester carboxylesterase